MSRTLSTLFKWKTYKTWIRKQTKPEGFRRLGRPRIPDALRRLVLRIGRENFCWGYRRVMGELKKLGNRVSPTTIRTVLRGSGFPPSPHRGVNPLPIAWTAFIHANIESVVATDFFTKKIHTLRGTLECLNHFVWFNRDQLDYINRIWIDHYNTGRPHRGVGIGNRVLDRSFAPRLSGTIRCRRRLGGIVTSYYREAA